MQDLKKKKKKDIPVVFSPRVAVSYSGLHSEMTDDRFQRLESTAVGGRAPPYADDVIVYVYGV